MKKLLPWNLTFTAAVSASTVRIIILYGRVITALLLSQIIYCRYCGN